MKTRLGDYIQQIRGVSYKPTDLSETLEDGYITLLRANNISESKVNFLDVQYVNKKKVSTEQILRNDDIIICSSSGSLALVGKSAIYEKTSEHTFGAFCKVVRTKSLLSPHYLAFYMCSRSYRQHIEHVAHGANINNLKNEHIDEIIIEVPSLDKQNLIVKKLRKIKRIIDNRRAQLAKLDELVKCRFIEMFGDPILNEKKWNTNPIKELTTKIGSGATPKGGDSAYKNSGISLIRSLNVHNNIFVTKDLAHIDNEQAEQLSNVTIQPEDVLLNITGASVARCCTVPEDILPARVNQHVCIIRCNELLTPLFLERLLTSDNYQTYLWKVAEGGGGTRQALTKQEIENFTVITPPITQQNTFANFVRRVDKLRFVIQQSLDETQKLFDSLMQEYFD